MHKFLISKYINKLSKEDINTFALHNDIFLNNIELDIVYKHVKNNWKNFLYDSPTPIFNDLKKYLSSTNYKKSIKLYHKYYDIYKDYL